MHSQSGLDRCIRDQGHGVNALLNQEGGKVGEVGRPLTADTDLAATILGRLDHHLDHLLHSGMTLIRDAGHNTGVTVKAVGELGQVVGADGEAVENVGKGIRADDVARNLAHHVKLQTILTLDQTAFTMCKENQLPIIVFNMNEKGNLKNLLSGKKVGTLVKI